MWGWVKDKAKKVGRALAGGLSAIVKGFSYGLHRFFGIGELFISLLGFKPKKKMRLKVLILRNEDNKPLFSKAEVQAVVDEAQAAFRREANIRIIPSVNNDEIVGDLSDQNPTWVMTPACKAGGYREIFTRVGKWFRNHSNPYSRRGGATVFIVEDVLEQAGCFIGPLVDYGYIDRDGLFDSPRVRATDGRKLLLAHELGHACDLFHRDDPSNLMAQNHQSPSGEQRTSHITRWQRSVIRSCPRVRYL